MVIEKKSSELIFISQIRRDGSGTDVVSPKYLKSMLENHLMKDDLFKLHRLSITEETFIAIGFNSFVVKLK